MDTLPANKLVLRPTWPIPQLGSGRIAYGIPLMMVTGAFLTFSVTRWLAQGKPQTKTELFWILMALAAAGTAVALAFLYDGITITASRERVIVTRWFRAPLEVSLSGVVAIQLSTEQQTGQHGQKIDHPIVSFITHDGQCVASLDWGQFNDNDLDQLSGVAGVRQDGGWFYKHSA